jgi:hypothetical protein
MKLAKGRHCQGGLFVVVFGGCLTNKPAIFKLSIIYV